MKLKRTKNKGIEGAGFEIYTFFTPLETRKPKRKTIPIENLDRCAYVEYYKNG